MKVQEVLKCGVENSASDIFIVAGSPIMYKAKGHLHPMEEKKLVPDTTSEIVKEIYNISGRNVNFLIDEGEDDFSFSINGVSRFRANAYIQRGSLAIAIRIIPFEMPDYRELMIPEEIMNFAYQSNGLVLVTGPAGSGKTTTLSCIIDRINSYYDKHIITIEDPIETLHRHKKSIVSQREVVTDTKSYVKALRSSLRQSPDVILLGEMRDYETIEVAMTAAETGHLIFSTLHTVGASNTIDRIIDVFPSNQQHQIRTQLSMVLGAVISQQLIPDVNGNMVPAFEIMKATNAVKNMIRESKVFRMDSVICSSGEDGMISMDTSIFKLYKDGIISKENAITYSRNSSLMARKVE